MAEIVKADYPCSQMDLYSVLETAWGNYQTHIAKFTEHKGFYTIGYATTALGAIQAAKQLPDDDTRSGASELLHINVVNLGRVCTQNFMKLRSYMETTYKDEEVLRVQEIMAGYNYLRAATRKDWESLLLMNVSAKNYLEKAENVDALTSGDNMPAHFVDVYKEAADAFDIEYNKFKLEEQTSVETAAKISANNECYKTCMAMMKDAQVIFANESEVAMKFVFRNLLDLINPPVAGVKGTVKAAGSNTPITNAVVTLQKEGGQAVPVEVSDEGSFEEQLPEGLYRMVVSATGYVSQEMEVDLKLNGLRTIHVLMTSV